MTTDQPIPPRPRNVNDRRPAPRAGAEVFPDSPAATDAHPAAQLAETPAPRSQITLSTVVEHRGRLITIQATDMTADQFCDLLDRRGFQAPEQARQWQTLPDGTPICPKHHAPMRLREKQGDSWYSHSVGEDANGKHIYCKGYHGKDSPGYDQ